MNVLNEWAAEHRVQMIVLVLVLLVAAAVTCVWFFSTYFPFGDPELQETVDEVDSVSEEEIVLEDETIDVTQEPVVEPTEEAIETTDTITPNVSSARVEIASCEQDVCNVPLWQSHERDIILGFVPAGAVVDVFACYYPVFQLEVETTVEPDDESPALFDHSEYSVEGLWCEVSYDSEEDGYQKGLILYRTLDFEYADNAETGADQEP
ncbi:MAG: hypothetical protein ACXABY_11655 [Candidatus Thorarchaeota archaeon]